MQKSLNLVFAGLLGATQLVHAQAGPVRQQAGTIMRMEGNILSEQWRGPYGGVPAFDKVQVGDFVPAVHMAIAEKEAEIKAIANNKAPADFNNTILALEKSGATMNRVMAVYNVWSSNKATPDFQKVQRELTPKLTALNSRINMNARLFARVEAVYNSRSRLTPEQQRLVWDYYTGFVRGGAKLNAADKVKLAEINKQLAGLYNVFNDHLLADENGKYVAVTSVDELKGMPADFIAAAAQSAKGRGLQGQWVIDNTRSSVDPILSFAQNRELRRKVWTMFVNRGDNGDANDNNAIIPQILKLRAQRAKLLGYPTHAHYMLEKSMAKTPEAAMDLMMKVWEPAVARVHEEVRDMQKEADLAGDRIKIEPWDYKYYQELVRKKRYDLDQAEVKQYLQLDKMVEGMFWAANKNYGLTFTEVHNVPVFAPGMRVWQVQREGKNLAVFYLDPYARAGKRSGAWMTGYREQDNLHGRTLPLVSDNLNIIQGADGAPTYLSWDDATTLFHEFGHALHGMLTNVTYGGLSGTNVVRDFVELPSQLNENWLATPEVLQKFAVNKDGKAIPEELVRKIKKAATFNQGFATVEFLASALMDMKLHLEGEKTIDADKFERETLAALHMPHEIVMRHRTPQFGHIFSSDGYSAGYYSYLWADVLVADAFEKFMEGSGPYDAAVARKYYEEILSKGNTDDPAKLYRNFRGREPEPAALMRKRGFITTTAKSE